MIPSEALPLALQMPDPRVIIRPVRMQDLPELLRDCWADRTENRAIEMIRRSEHNSTQRRGIGVVAIDPQTPGKIVSYGQLTMWSRCGEISDLVVSGPRRSQGIGTAIIQYLVNEARQIPADCIEIGVALANLRALNLYQRLGFKDSYRLTLNLGNGPEAVLYLRLLFADYA